MASNLTGSSQTYGASQTRILQGLRPDIVAMQEFNVAGDLRGFVDTTFGADFSVYRESNYTIPNGIVSRWPILAAGSWVDVVQSLPNRGFAWALIDLPGANDLYVVSVHLLTSSSVNRANEAANLKSLIQSNLPPGAWIVVAGDFNTDSRSEVAVTTLTSFLSDEPVPTDTESGGNPNTNEPRSKPYDYVLPSFSLTNFLVGSAFASHTFPAGLVFDSRAYSPLSDVAPVLGNDSANGQHMAVVKDFLIPGNLDDTNPPAITSQPRSQTAPYGSNVTFAVQAIGAAPLSYQWRVNDHDLAGATWSSLLRTNVQPGDAGEYSVVVSNPFASVTSAPALLAVESRPIIVVQPQSLAVNLGGNASFAVLVSGAPPLAYQWRYNGTNLPGVSMPTLMLTNVQAKAAGDYTVVITNFYGNITSEVAVLSISSTPPGELTTLVGWDVSTLSSFGPSPLPPTTNAPHLTVIGLARGAGVTTNTSAAGRAWGGNGFDATDPSAAVAAGDFCTFTITPDTGYRVSFNAFSRFDYRRSGTGPPNGRLQFQKSGGVFNDLATLAYTNSTSSGASLNAIDLSNVAALQNVPAGTTVSFRFVNYGGSSGGTWYVFDVGGSSELDLVVSGTVTPVSSSSNALPAAAVLSASLASSVVTLNLTGAPGTNYVIQASTNLTADNWLSLATNVAPFSFGDSNAPAFRQRFYRAIWQP